MPLLQNRPYFVFDQFVFLCHMVYFAFVHSNLNAFPCEPASQSASQHPCHVSIAMLELKFNSVFICTKRKLKSSEQQQAAGKTCRCRWCVCTLPTTTAFRISLPTQLGQLNLAWKMSSGVCRKLRDETAYPFDILRRSCCELTDNTSPPGFVLAIKSRCGLRHCLNPRGPQINWNCL